MGKASTPASFKRDFCRRLKIAREFNRLEQADMAKALGLLPNTYSKYESRSLLPHHLMLKACEILKIDLGYLYGVDAGPNAKARVVSEEATEGERSRSRGRA